MIQRSIQDDTDHQQGGISKFKEVENHLADLASGSFVAIYLDNWNKTPVIGKVNEVKENLSLSSDGKGPGITVWRQIFIMANHGQMNWQKPAKY